uniref:helix-turn-helix domain-containing protein n=1 Tax=Anaerobutyricum hallii TaxID=39488 RepID=UPI003FED9B9B
MVANRAYKFRIYPDDEQKILFAKTFGCVRMVYNHSVGHTGIARICLAYSVIKREPNLPRLGSPTSTGGEDVTKR